MHHVACTIRDYSSGGDTCSVEMQGAGVVEAWIDGVRIDPTVNRAYLMYGAAGVVSFPDINRPCDATLTAITPPSNLQVASNGVPQRTETGRALIATDGLGNGSVTAVFSPAFSATPAIYAQADSAAAVTLSGALPAQFTASVSGQTPNAYLWISWSATGNA